MESRLDTQFIPGYADLESWLYMAPTIVNCVKELRTAQGWTQEQLAQAAGVSRQSINAIERERYVPSLELALIDAWAAGGNYVLTLTPEHRQELLSGKPEALAVWRRLGRTARWLRENAALFRQPTLPNITLLVERGDTTAELANLMYRQNASPRLVNAANPPAPDPLHCAVLVAAGIRSPSASVADRILAHAEAGATVVTDATQRRDARRKSAPAPAGAAAAADRIWTPGRPDEDEGPKRVN